MKAITLTQPWATLVAIGAKRIETRSWSTKYRGPLAIHAAKGWTEDVVRLAFIEPFKPVLNDAGYKLFSLLPRGAIVATCNLIDCVPITSKREVYGYVVSMGYNVVIPPDGNELAFGDYTPGRFAWLLADVQELPAPVPERVALGLWECAL